MKFLMGILLLNMMVFTQFSNGQNYQQNYGQPDTYEQWCDNSLETLSSHRQDGQYQYLRGNYSDALQTLRRGINTILRRLSYSQNNSLSVQTLRRASVYLNIIEQTATNSQNTQRVQSYFLLSYYDLVKQVIEELDYQYYDLGCGYSCSRRRGRRSEDFERLFTRLSALQTHTVIETLTELVQERRRNLYYPISSAQTYLKSLEQSIDFIATDLQSSLSNIRYACVISDLQQLKDRLSRYNRGQSTFHNDFEAVQTSTREVKALIGNILNPCNQSHSRVGPTPALSTIDIISSSIRLNSGTTHSVPLKSQRYIKNIIVSAEGIVRDAMFDVVVNGKVKGTIYVPGRDPSYFVTIEEETSSIQFVSRNGNARIMRILAVGNHP